MCFLSEIPNINYFFIIVYISKDFLFFKFLFLKNILLMYYFKIHRSFTSFASVILKFVNYSKNNNNRLLFSNFKAVANPKNMAMDFLEDVIRQKLVLYCL